MEATFEAISPAIGHAMVLASILAGFAFSIAAQIALGQDRTREQQRIAQYFFQAGVLSLTTIVIGILLFVHQDDPAAVSGARLFFATLVVTGGVFLAGSFLLVRSGFDADNSAFLVLFTVVCALWVGLLWLVLSRNL